MGKRVCIIMPPAYGLFDQRTNIPLGPLYVAAICEEAGHEVILISLLGHDIPASWPKADLYAMGFTTPQAGAAKGIMELIHNQYYDAKVLAAGAHPTWQPVETLQAGFDSVLIGEGENAILQILADLPHLMKTYQGVPRSDLDKIPFPARHLLPHKDVHNDAGGVFSGLHQKEHIATMMGSRGCYKRCSFCANPRLARTKHRSANNIIAEMKELYERGITCFKFQDDTFTFGSKHVIELGAAAEKQFEPGQIVVRMCTRVDTFSERIVPALKQLQLEVASFGIESGSQKILDIIHKDTTIKQAEEALRLAHDSGFTTLGFFMFGLPGECERTVDETIAFWERNKPYLDTANLSAFTPYPGSDIANRPAFYRMHVLDTDQNHYWITQKKTVLALPYDVSFQKMMDLRKRTYEAFAGLGYARPDWKHDL